MTTATPTITIDIPLDLLVDCPLNTRTINPDSPAIRGLADSLTHRQIEALKVRPVGARYEVIDGKRRHTAGRLAQLPTLRAEVGEYSDNEALSIILVSQLQREGLDPLEEAGLIRQLLDAGMTLAEAASELGHDAGWVAKRSRLTALAAPWREKRPAWATIAYLEVVARLPEQVQCEIAKDYAQDWQRPASVADFDMEIRERYLHQLKHAPWKLDDLAVLPKATPCTSCPKRSSCQTTLFDAEPGDDDRCLDAVCWSEKLTAHTSAKAQALALKHPKVLILTASPGSEHPQPPPTKLPENAVALPRTFGLEDCRKSDDGAMPALDAETGKQSWVKVGAGAAPKLRAALGMDDAPPATGKAAKAGTSTAPTAAQRREAQRLAWRIDQLRDELATGDPPSAKTILALYAVFVLGTEATGPEDPLDMEGWKAVEKWSVEDLDPLVRPMWDALVDHLQRLLSIRLRPAALPPAEAIAELETLAALIPAEQTSKALREVPEPKRKG